MTTNEATIFLGQRQIDLYRSAPEVYIRAFRAGSCNREIISQYYSLMVRKGLIMPLEGPWCPEYKDEVAQMAIEFAEGKLNLTGCLNMAKLIHIIGNHA